MKRTIILSPYKKGFSGTAELIGNSLSLTVNHPDFSGGEFFGLYALSTSRAAAYPYTVGSYEAVGCYTEIAGNISAEGAGNAGYRVEDIDTFLLTLQRGGSEEAVAAAFFGLEWNAAKFLTRKPPEEKDDEHVDETDNTVDNAEKLLRELKGTGKISSEKVNRYIEDFKRTIRKYEKCNDLESDGFEWYKITAGSSVTALSAVRHVLSGRTASSCISEAGYYIAGIKRGDTRHIAIGIPGCRHICPTPQLSDCCRFEGGYHIAGIYLAEDGQYFEKYLQNDK